MALHICHKMLLVDCISEQLQKWLLEQFLMWWSLHNHSDVFCR